MRRLHIGIATRSAKKARSQPIQSCGVFPLDIWRLIVAYLPREYIAPLYASCKALTQGGVIRYGLWSPRACMEEYATNGHWALVKYAITKWSWTVDMNYVLRAIERGHRLKASVHGCEDGHEAEWARRLLLAQHRHEDLGRYSLRTACDDLVFCIRSNNLESARWVMAEVKRLDTLKDCRVRREKFWKEEVFYYSGPKELRFSPEMSEWLFSERKELAGISRTEFQLITTATATFRSGNPSFWLKTECNWDHYRDWAASGEITVLRAIEACPGLYEPQDSVIAEAILRALDYGRIDAAKHIVSVYGCKVSFWLRLETFSVDVLKWYCQMIDHLNADQKARLLQNINPKYVFIDVVEWALANLTHEKLDRSSSHYRNHFGWLLRNSEDSAPLTQEDLIKNVCKTAAYCAVTQFKTPMERFECVRPTLLEKPLCVIGVLQEYGIPRSETRAWVHAFGVGTDFENEMERMAARDVKVGRQYLECFDLPKHYQERLKLIIEDTLTLSVCKKGPAFHKRRQDPQSRTFLHSVVLE